MEELIKISPCTGEKPSSLRYVFDKIDVNVRGLSAMGISSAQYGSLLIPIIMSKITPELRLRIARETKKDVWEMGELLDLIKQEVEVREASEQVKIHTMKSHSGVTNRGPNYTASSLVSNSLIRCVYCNESHYSASCKRIPNVRECKDILFRTGRYFNCLKTSHKSQDCDSVSTLPQEAPPIYLFWV